MAASMEMRVPFLENDLIDFGLHLPRRAKLHRNTGKWLVKQAATEVLPPDVVFARKKGFPFPTAYALGTERLLAGGMLAEFMQWPAATIEEITGASARRRRPAVPPGRPRIVVSACTSAEKPPEALGDSAYGLADDATRTLANMSAAQTQGGGTPMRLCGAGRAMG